MKQIKCRAWDKIRKRMVYDIQFTYDKDSCFNDMYDEQGRQIEEKEVMLFTGLKDKKDDTFIYEGDFIDMDGKVRGNIYENKKELQALLKRGIDCLVISMETKTWGSTIKEAIRRGCQFAE